MLAHHLLELPEDARLLVGRHADPTVLHLQQRRAPVRAEPQGHGSAHAELEGVGEQVLDDLLGREPIPQPTNTVLDLELEHAAAVGSRHGVALGDHTHELGQVGRGWFQLQVAGRDAADIQQPGRPPDELPGGVLQVLQQGRDARGVGAFGLAHGGERCLRHANERRHRIAQLVRGNSDEVVPGTDRLLQLLKAPAQVEPGAREARSVLRLQPCFAARGSAAMVGGVFSGHFRHGPHGADHHHPDHAPQPAEAEWLRWGRHAAADAGWP